MHGHFKRFFAPVVVVAGFLLHPPFASSQASAANAPRSTWYLTGSAPEFYEAGWLTGANSAFYLRSRTPSLPHGFGTWSKYVDATPFLGKRLRLSANVKAHDVSGWGGLWMRIDGKNGRVLGFDNMQNRPVHGTTSARPYEVVLDVPPDAVSIGYGVLLAESGDLKVTDVALNTVGSEIATTHSNTSSLDAVRGDWFLAGSRPTSYIAGPVGNRGSDFFLRSKSAESIDGFGTWMTTVDASKYTGKRVRVHALISTNEVKGWAGLWLRVDGGGNVDDGSKMLSFDNMSNRPLRGTAEKKTCDVVLNVPNNATKIAYGVLLTDSGEVRTSPITLEIVSNSVPLTGKQNR